MALKLGISSIILGCNYNFSAFGYMWLVENRAFPHIQWLWLNDQLVQWLFFDIVGYKPNFVAPRKFRSYTIILVMLLSYYLVFLMVSNWNLYTEALFNRYTDIYTPFIYGFQYWSRGSSLICSSMDKYAELHRCVSPSKVSVVSGMKMIFISQFIPFLIFLFYTYLDGVIFINLRTDMWLLL